MRAILFLAATLPATIAAAGELSREPIEAPLPAFAHLDSPGLDALVAAGLKRHEPWQIVDDETFLRRAMLDLWGRQPTPEELAEFRADESAGKRRNKVDQLLAAPEFGSSWARYWSDTISYRVPPPELTFLDYGPFENWLAEQINTDVPWNETVSKILTGTGKVGEHPEATFVAYHGADAVRLASETARIFLSVQVQCAQCHDHPFDDWKREQFHHFAAFFARASVKFPWNDGLQTEIKEKEKGEYVMPNMDPAQKGTRMNPSFLTGASAGKGQSDRERRAELARFVTSSGNPWFAKAYVNRAWSRMMGRGFAEPIDDISDQMPRSLPEVHDVLSERFTGSGFDVKDLFRLIANSSTYQRIALAQSESKEDPLTATVVAKLRGDEVYESLSNAIELPNYVPPKLAPTKEIRFPPPSKSTRDLVAETFGFDPSLTADAVMRTMNQAMFLMNDYQISTQIDGRPNHDTMLSRVLEQDDLADDAAVQVLFKRVLGRQATAEELQISVEHVQSTGDRRAGFEDLLWSLINTAEFTSKR